MVRNLIQILLLAFLIKEASIRFLVNTPSPEPLQVISAPVEVVCHIREKSILRPERRVAPVQPLPTQEELQQEANQKVYESLAKSFPPILSRIEAKLDDLSKLILAAPQSPPEPPTIVPPQEAVVVPEPPPTLPEAPQKPPEPIKEVEALPILTTWVDDYTKAKQLSIELKRPILMSFGETGCYYCELLKTTTFLNPDVRRYLSTNFVLQRVFLSLESGVPSTPSAQALVSRFGVSRWPTIVIYNPLTNTYKKIAPSNQSFYDPTSFIRMIEPLAASIK